MAPHSSVTQASEQWRDTREEWREQWRDTSKRLREHKWRAVVTHVNSSVTQVNGGMPSHGHYAYKTSAYSLHAVWPSLPWVQTVCPPPSGTLFARGPAASGPVLPRSMRPSVLSMPYPQLGLLCCPIVPCPRPIATCPQSPTFQAPMPLLRCMLRLCSPCTHQYT